MRVEVIPPSPTAVEALGDPRAWRGGETIWLVGRDSVEELEEIDWLRAQQLLQLDTVEHFE